MEEQQKKNRDMRNITLSIVGVLVLIAVVSGGTYAYYAFTASNATTISGSAAKASGQYGMTVTKLAPSGSNTTLVPQLTTALPSAIIGTGNNKCVDGNGNTVCLIYKIDLTNSTSASFNYKLRFNITNGSNSKFTNLKFAELPVASYSATQASGIAAVTATSATTTATDLKTGTLTTSGATVYMIIWLYEPNTEQASTDYGTFTGTISLVDSVSGQARLTSTFTS